MSEITFQKWCVATATAQGWLVRKLKFEGRRGAPDLLMCKAGKVLFIELKNPNGRGVLSAGQVSEAHALASAGMTVLLVTRKDEFIDVLQAPGRLNEGSWEWNGAVWVEQ